MLLTITTTHQPATDLGYLLHKNPGRLHDVELTFGVARVFYPEAADDRCTAVLLLDVDPIALTRRKADDAALEPYVNDRPYVVSSFMSVAISRVFGTALGGRSKERPELAAKPVPLVAEMPATPTKSSRRAGRTGRRATSKSPSVCTGSATTPCATSSNASRRAGCSISAAARASS